MIDTNKQYRARDGRVFGASIVERDNYVVVEVTEGGCLTCKFVVAETQSLADNLTEQIPWEALRPEIQWVAMQPFEDDIWIGGPYEPRPHGHGHWCAAVETPISDVVTMPKVDPTRWEETLCKRPEGR